MIQLDHTFLLKTKIGTKNGLSEKELKKACAKLAPLVVRLFDRQHQAGYAFLTLPDDRKLVKEIKAFAADQKGKWRQIVVLGIGGSALGLIALNDALIQPRHYPKLYVLDTIEPEWTSWFLGSLDFKKTLFIVISKSGATVEPMALYGIIKDRVSPKQLVFITDPKSGLLRKIAQKEGIKTFEVPTKVGGRFSVLSSAGLLPAALAGFDLPKLLRGARVMREAVRKTKGVKNPALLLAFAQHFLDRKKGKSMTVMMPYSLLLFRLSDWYRQLLAESLGKNPATGPTPLRALGPTDQHSQLQLYKEGPDNKWFMFLRTLRPRTDLRLGPKALPGEMGFLNGKKLSEILEAAYHGTIQSLAKSGRPQVMISLPKIDEESLGELFMLFMTQVALLGMMYHVDAFDQPGVEESKQITKKILINAKTKL